MSTGTDAARSAVYGLLAAPLHNPGPDQAAAVAAGEWAAELSGALSRLGVGWRPPLPLPPEELAEAYYQAFGRPRGALRPIESVYKPWTSDPTAELALARSRGWLGGDPAAHLRDLYQAVGITTPRALAHAPDHLALELEFMASWSSMERWRSSGSFCSSTWTGYPTWWLQQRRWRCRPSTGICST